jgi:hypothetical protein
MKTTNLNDFMKTGSFTNYCSPKTKTCQPIREVIPNTDYNCDYPQNNLLHIYDRSDDTMQLGAECELPTCSADDVECMKKSKGGGQCNIDAFCKRRSYMSFSNGCYKSKFNNQKAICAPLKKSPMQLCNTMQSMWNTNQNKAKLAAVAYQGDLKLGTIINDKDTCYKNTGCWLSCSSTSNGGSCGFDKVKSGCFSISAYSDDVYDEYTLSPTTAPTLKPPSSYTGDASKFEIQGTPKLWPPSTCYRTEFLPAGNRKTCPKGFQTDYTLGILGCRSNCRDGWVACGDKGMFKKVCGQTGDSCAALNEEVISAGLSALAQITAMVFTFGAAEIAIAAKNIAKTTLKITNKVQKLVTALKSSAKLLKKLDDLKAYSERAPQLQEFIDNYKRMSSYTGGTDVSLKDNWKMFYTTMGPYLFKNIGSEVLGALDPTGVANIALIFLTIPYCNSEDYYWFHSEYLESGAATDAQVATIVQEIVNN